MRKKRQGRMGETLRHDVVKSGSRRVDSSKSGKGKLCDTMSQSLERGYMGADVVITKMRDYILPPIRAEPMDNSKQPTAQL